MKVAIACDDLVQFGGQEKIVMELLRLFPGAPVYSAVISKKWQKILKEKNVKYVTSFMQKLPFVEKINRYYFPLLFHILAFESFNFSKFDLVISVSSRFAHHIITKHQTKHICYMNSPGRMFWEHSKYFDKESYGLLKPLKAFGDWFVAFPCSYIRSLDFTAAQRIDYFISNSKNVSNKILKCYKRASKIIYPFIELEKVERDIKDRKWYFAVVTRLSAWKRVDIAILACKKLGLSLKIIGDGPDIGRLKKLAGGSNLIEFLGKAPDEVKFRALKNCLALINTQYEDFGIVPLEAMACGKPVVAFGKGGVLETVIPGQTGEFFSQQTPESLAEVLENFKPSKYKIEDCMRQVKKFDVQTFKKEMLEFVKKLNVT